MAKILKSFLFGELSKFGLNSVDWDLEKDNGLENTFLLVNRHDPDFKLRGIVEYQSENTAHWTELSIASI